MLAQTKPAGRHGHTRGPVILPLVQPIVWQPHLPGMNLDPWNRSFKERVEVMAKLEHQWLGDAYTRWMLLPQSGRLAEVTDDGFLSESWAAEKNTRRIRELIDDHKKGGSPKHIMAEVIVTVVRDGVFLDRVIGRVWFRGLDTDAIDLGFLVDPEFQHRGVGTHIMSQTIEHARNLALQPRSLVKRLTLGTFRDNTAMRKLALRSGFRRSGLTQPFKVNRPGPRPGTRVVAKVPGILYELDL